MRVPVYVLDRHVHLSKLDSEKLFWKWYVFEKEKKFTQPWDFFAKEKVKTVWTIWEIENVNILLPFRKNTQVEMFESDNEVLWINAKYTSSWKLEDAEAITIVWPKWSVYLPHTVIIEQPHIHMSVAQSEDFGFRNNQIVKVKTHWENEQIIENVKIRVNDKFEFDFHINKELGNKYWLETNDWVEILN